ncbi:hypothetical protein [Nocardioides sp. Root190]|uniref:hypothetical protein n=1 Tax=Nocardioides sp. Root190 TaxID=1736488 RepID=UPI0012FBB23E|nr:hypothetical protein [Nocardioides sp. Root190]
MTERSHRDACDAAMPQLAEGASFNVPQVAHQKTWTDPDGVTWRARGQGPLAPRAARRLFDRPEVRIMHIDGGDAHEHAGRDREGLIAEVTNYWAARADPMTSFEIREFRNESRAVLVVIQQHC